MSIKNLYERLKDETIEDVVLKKALVPVEHSAQDARKL